MDNVVCIVYHRRGALMHLYFMRVSPESVANCCKYITTDGWNSDFLLFLYFYLFIIFLYYYFIYSFYLFHYYFFCLFVSMICVFYSFCFSILIYYHYFIEPASKREVPWLTPPRQLRGSEGKAMCNRLFCITYTPTL